MRIERPWASLEAKLNELKVDCEFPALLDDCEITRHREQLALPGQHPNYTHQQNLDHAVARALAHQQNRRRPEPVVQHVEHHQHIHHGWRWWEWVLAALLVLGLMVWSAKAHGQNVVIRGAAKGTTPAANTTATASDGNHTGLDVNCVSGCGAGSGAVAIADGTTPANKATVDSGNLHVNCAVGCAGGSTTPTDAFANPTTAGIQFTFPGLYNGTTWDRWRGDLTNGAWVNIKATISLPVTGTFWQATQPVSCANGATCPTNATLAAETTKIIGTVRILGNAGAIMDAVIGASAPPNVLQEGLKDTAGNSQAALSDTNGRQFVKTYPDTTTTSYHASAKFAASSTTDNAVLPGNATNTVLVTKITVTCTEATAGQINVELLKRSVADTVGTAANMTVVPDDANYAGGVSVPKSYTGTGPTVGTAVGDLDNAQIGCMAAATATPNDVYVFRPLKPIVLRGTAQMLAINVGNAALTGGNLTVTFDWMETTTP